MNERFLGVPLIFWGIGCLAVALVWVFVWPAERAVGVGGLRWFLIRWGHTLTWICLAACVLCAPAVSRNSYPGRPVGLLGLAAYIGFLGATFIGS
ncbi:hypothetical protein HC891_12135 [Candidatus Gracilibacteria bacterium]|nr:hypothetical protein [Candidatus Gracilibacteria bacterium]